MMPMMRPYRGPQRIGGPTIAVFIDVDNTNMSRDNFLEVFSLLRNQGVVTYGKLYGYRGGRDIEFDEIIAEYRLETVGMMRYKFGEASCVDPRLVIDSMAAADSRLYDAIFIWAGVGDMMNVFAHIKQRGRKVITVDLPAFDTTNRFVDTKIKLFSPHTLKRAESPSEESSSMPASHSKASAPAPKPSKSSKRDKGDLDDFPEDTDDDIAAGGDLAGLGDGEIEDLSLDELAALGTDDFDDIDSIADLEEEQEEQEDDFNDFSDIKEGIDPGGQVSNYTPAKTGGGDEEMTEEEKEELMKMLEEAKAFSEEQAIGTMDIGDVGAARRSEKKTLYGSEGFNLAMEDSAPAVDHDKVKPHSDFDDFGNL